jgi:hypothetical protein
VAEEAIPVRACCTADRWWMRRTADHPCEHSPFDEAAGGDGGNHCFTLSDQGLELHTLQQLRTITLGLAVLHAPERVEIVAMPSSYLIDRKGVIRHIHHGFRKEDIEGIRQLVVALLAEPSGP